MTWRCSVLVAHLLAELFHQRRLARANRAADADAKGAVSAGRGPTHVTKSLTCRDSCRIAAMSDKSAAEPRSSSVEAPARAAAARMTGSSSTMTATPSVWPMRHDADRDADQIGGEGVQPGDEGGFQRDASRRPRRRRPRRDRRSRPPSAGGPQARAADWWKASPWPSVSRRRSREGAMAARRAPGDLGQDRGVTGRRSIPGGLEQHRVRSELLPCSMRPAIQADRVSASATASSRGSPPRLQPVRIAERAPTGKAGRKPGEEFQEVSVSGHGDDRPQRDHGHGRGCGPDRRRPLDRRLLRPRGPGRPDAQACGR